MSAEQVTRDSLLEDADTLGITVDPKWTDDELARIIAETLENEEEAFLGPEDPEKQDAETPTEAFGESTTTAPETPMAKASEDVKKMVDERILQPLLSSDSDDGVVILPRGSLLPSKTKDYIETQLTDVELMVLETVRDSQTPVDPRQLVEALPGENELIILWKLKSLGLVKEVPYNGRACFQAK
jgi:hypothetical protein